MTIPYVTELFGGAVQVFAPEFYSEFETDPTFTPTFTVQVDLRELLPSLADVPLGNHTLTAILLGGLTAEEQASIGIDSETSHTVVYAATEAALDPVLLQIQALVDHYELGYNARPLYVRGGYA